MRKLLLMLAASTLFAGCVSEPVPLWRAENIEKTRINPKFLDTKNRNVVTITRDDDYSIIGCEIVISINSQQVVSMKRGEKAVLRLPNGEFDVVASPKGCASPAKSEFNLDVKNSPENVRVFWGQGGGLYIDRMNVEHTRSRLLHDEPY